MEKKNKKVLVIVLLLVITNAMTALLSNIIPIKAGKKVIISEDDFETLNTAYKEHSKIDYIQEIIDKDYYQEPDSEKYIDGILKGMVASLEDPYSVYLTEKEYSDIMEDNEGVFGGIGVIVTPGEDNMITVVSPIEDTPGERAGIRSGDKIIKVEDEEFTADQMDRAVTVMKGEPGTEVALTILREKRDGSNDIKELTIIREEIRANSVKSSMIDELGYIKLTSFDELTYGEFKEELNNLKGQNMEGLIIDLRNNPGGLLSSCRDITDELIGKGDIVYTEDRDGKREYLKSGANELDMPLVILINGGSASASEILAGAVKDHEKAKLVGNTTFGKGLVQNIRQLPDGSGLKLTISQYYTPNGTNIHGVGIAPDYEVELPEDIEGIGVEYIEQDTQLQKAIEVIREEK